MKATFEIPDPLLDQARKIAAREGVTLGSLVEQGLRKGVAGRSAKAKPFKLRQVTAGTPGVQSPYEKASWEEKLEMMYEGRGV